MYRIISILCLLLSTSLIFFVDPGKASKLDNSEKISKKMATNSWEVFVPANKDLPMGENLISNSGFEIIPLSENGWKPLGFGFQLDNTGGRGGGRAIMLAKPISTDEFGIYQEIMINQITAKSLYFSGWSKAENISSIYDYDYSMYLDLYFSDGSHSYGERVNFNVGTHDWQFRDRFINTSKPIKSIFIYCVLRNSAAGIARFDDLVIREVQNNIAIFDGQLVADVTPSTMPNTGSDFSLVTNDGLAMNISEYGGIVSRLNLNGTSILDTGHNYASGFFIKDVAQNSNYIHVGGGVVENSSSLVQSSDISSLGMAFSATYHATVDRINIHASLTNFSDIDRAITLYFALPVIADGWTWGDGFRSNLLVSGTKEFSNLSKFAWNENIGATGKVSRYPWTSLSKGTNGLALAIPLDEPCIARLAYNPDTQQYYIAFDLGISEHTTKFSNQAWVDLVIYQFPGEWGFRSASQGYYDRFSSSFARRIPLEKEGIWVPFSDIHSIENVEDFGIKIHELYGLGQVKYDEALNVSSFRYLSEPWSHWFEIDAPSVDPNNYDQVINYLRQTYLTGANKEEAEVTLSSGIFDQTGRYTYLSTTATWCKGIYGCALFMINADPDLVDNNYPLNKANYDWNINTKQSYITTPGLDGELLDSFTNHGHEIDFREEHWAATNTPLSFQYGTWKVGNPLLFSTVEFSRWVAQDVHDNNRWMMANGAYIDTFWGADLLDYAGQETNWLINGVFTPESDTNLMFMRSISKQRPYGLLLDANFYDFNSDYVERYFQICMFYGIYPTMFSHNGAEDRYWDDPTLYNRDRLLFKRYIPIIKDLNRAAWQPITYATTDQPDVYIERFGNSPNVQFSLRNTLSTPIKVKVTIDSNRLEWDAKLNAAQSKISGITYQLQNSGNNRSFNIELPPLSSEVVTFTEQKIYLPLVVKPGLSYDIPSGYSVYDHFQREEPLTNRWKITNDSGDCTITPFSNLDIIQFHCKNNLNNNSFIEIAAKDLNAQQVKGVAATIKMDSPVVSTSGSRIDLISFMKDPQTNQENWVYFFSIRGDRVYIVEYQLPGYLNGKIIGIFNISSQKYHLLQSEFKNSDLRFYLDSKLLELQSLPSVSGNSQLIRWSISTLIPQTSNEINLTATVDWVAIIP